MEQEALSVVMVIALFALILFGIPVPFALAASGIVFGLIGFGTDLFNLLPLRIYGVVTNYSMLAIPLFVFMGVLLEKSRLAERMLDVIGHMAGQRAGGMAFAIVLVGVLMGASTGIVAATVVTVGLITLPTLLRRNYDPRVACGTICASGTLGQIIPPSLVLILLSDITGTSVGTLFAAAMIPGLILAGLYLVYILGLGRLRRRGARRSLARCADAGSTQGGGATAGIDRRCARFNHWRGGRPHRSCLHGCARCDVTGRGIRTHEQNRAARGGQLDVQDHGDDHVRVDDGTGIQSQLPRPGWR